MRKPKAEENLSLQKKGAFCQERGQKEETRAIRAQESKRHGSPAGETKKRAGNWRRFGLAGGVGGWRENLLAQESMLIDFGLKLFG